MNRPSLPATALSRRPMQERSQHTVRRILDATLSLLAREGIEGLTTNHIAGEAGLSVASLYRFFPNKQAVIYAAYGEWIEELSERIAAQVAHWKVRLVQDPQLWPEAAAAIAAILGDSRRGARVEYELLRAMFSHRELLARDATHTSDLADNVAILMRLAGSRVPPHRLATIAAFANEQYTLAAEMAGHRPEHERADFVALAEATFMALWRDAIEGGGRDFHETQQKPL